MSGIVGIIRLDGTAVAKGDIEAMLAPMARRGPDRRQSVCMDNAGFGQALLATTPEALAEVQPWSHPDSGCIVVSDSRLDNRPELLDALGLANRSVDSIGDGELLHAAYQRWGDDCADRLRGDFAFALWEPKQQTLFCARDIMGVRPFYFHHAPGRLFTFASDIDALLALREIPRRLNEGRVADALMSVLEGIDRTSTFFLNIARLPPARTLRLVDDVATQIEYWNPLKTCPDSLPTSDAEWVEALRAHLADAVRSRLRSSHRVGAMVSGGLDSSSVAALAQQILADGHRERLATFSAINSQGECVETAAVQSMLASFNFDASKVDLQNLGTISPAVCAQLDETCYPFDDHMTLISAVYSEARAAGVRSMLDGVPADNLYTVGGYFERLVRSGQLRLAWREARAQRVNQAVAYPGLRACQTLLGALAPTFLRKHWEHWGDWRSYRRLLEVSLISSAFAGRVNLWQRFKTFRNDTALSRLSDISGQAQSTMTAAYITAAVERYNRIASFHGIEPRHPFLDRQIIELHAWMPLLLRLHNGYYKWVFRQAMSNLLPADIAWRRGREHLGYLFNRSIHPHQGIRSHLSSVSPPVVTTFPTDAIDWKKFWIAKATALVDAGTDTGLPAACALIDWAERVLHEEDN